MDCVNLAIDHLALRLVLRRGRRPRVQPRPAQIRPAPGQPPPGPQSRRGIGLARGAKAAWGGLVERGCWLAESRQSERPVCLSRL